MGACHIAPAAGREVCEHAYPTAHSFPQPAGYLQGWWQVPGAGVRLHSMPSAYGAPQAPSSGREGGVCMGSRAGKGYLTHTHTRRAAPAWPSSAALSHLQCRLPSSVCIFVTSPSSGPSPGRKLCLRWMKRVCSSLLPSSPDSEEDELLPRTPRTDPSLARLQRRWWPRSPPWGSQGNLGSSGTTEHPKGSHEKTSAGFLGVKVVF